MEDDRFDGLARGAGTRFTRRTTLGAALAGLLASGAALEGLVGGPDAAAKKKPNKCRYPTKKCGKKCVRVLNDRNNCGRCGRKCASDEFCNGGTCEYTGVTCPGDVFACSTIPFTRPCNRSTDCFCQRTAEDQPVCGRTTGACGSCTTSTDCAGPDEQCAIATGDTCDCTPGQGFCIRACPR